MTFPESLRRGLRPGLAGLLLFAFGVASAQARGESSVWTINGRHNTVYLAGSVHALPKDHSELPPALERAYAASRRIVMEVDLDDLDPMEAVKFVTTNGTLPPEQTLGDLLGPEKYAVVTRLAATINLPEFALEKLEPWAAAMVLTQVALMKSGFDPQLGIDMQIVERAKVDHKRIDGLETVTDQLGVFDSQSLEDQTKFLLESADDVPKMQADLDSLVTAWRAGDLRALEREFLKERDQAPGLYDALLGARNRKWLPQIEALLNQDEDILVVVGALHYVGHDGLIELLTKAGHKPVPLHPN
jgi:uncharacterized protein YbaP (TraB family)